MNVNEKAIRDGIKKANAIIADRVSLAFAEVGRELLQDAEGAREYRNLTGNTLTSLAFGFYQNYTLREIIFVESGKPALRVKLDKGEIVSSFIDYDGNMRPYFKADIDTDGSWGATSTYQFLRQYKPLQPTAIVLCTGTEYSEYLERELGLNVLTDTYMEAKSRAFAMFKNNFKTI